MRIEANPVTSKTVKSYFLKNRLNESVFIIKPE